jgi:hypothetical protein
MVAGWVPVSADAGPSRFAGLPKCLRMRGRQAGKAVGTTRGVKNRSQDQLPFDGGGLGPGRVASSSSLWTEPVPRLSDRL